MSKSVNPSGNDALNRYKVETSAEGNAKLYANQKGEMKAGREGNIGNQMSKTIIKAYEGGLQ